MRIWTNQSGNSFSAPTTLTRFPVVAWPIEVLVADLRGDGTACLVWSSPLLSHASRPVRGNIDNVLDEAYAMAAKNAIFVQPSPPRTGSLSVIYKF